MTDTLHDRLADALRSYPTGQDDGSWLQRKQEALAAYEAVMTGNLCDTCAKRNVSCPIEPLGPVTKCHQYSAKAHQVRVKLPKPSLWGNDGTDCIAYEETVEMLKAQGVEVSAS